jgi:hypothetical protein
MNLRFQRESPETGSRIPSISTGGAAMNAIIKTEVAVNKVGNGCSFPDWLKMQTNSSRSRNNGTGNNIVSLKMRSRNRFKNTINIYWRSRNECDNKNRSCGQ